MKRRDKDRAIEEDWERITVIEERKRRRQRKRLQGTKERYRKVGGRERERTKREDSRTMLRAVAAFEQHVTSPAF